MQVVASDEDTSNQNRTPSTPLSFIPSIYCHYFHVLLIPSNTSHTPENYFPQIILAEMMQKPKFLLYVLYSCYMKFYLLYIPYMHYMFCYIFIIYLFVYIFICIYLFVYTYIYLYLFLQYLILNLCDNVFNFIICPKFL